MVTGRADRAELAPLAQRLAERIRASGPVPFAEVMRAALYDPADGFYSSGGAAGRRGDFITSPEVGPLFGAVVARMLDAEWDRLGRPGRFTVVEAAAGVGTLAVAVRAAAPACLVAGALRYVLVEQSPVLRVRHGDHLPVADETADPGGLAAGGPVGPDPVSAGDPPGPAGDGVFVSASDLPDEPFDGVVLANELLDNLPVRLLERSADGWAEVLVGVDAAGHLVETLGPVADDGAVRATRLAPDATIGARLPLADEAVAWAGRARSLVRRGSVALVDYGDTTASLTGRPPAEWLRTYRGHERGVGPLEDLGAQDVTCEVPVDQFDGFDREVQADWLARHGLDELVEEGRRAWHARTVTDLAAIRARSRVHEAEALTDRSGLGAFHVLTATS